MCQEALIVNLDLVQYTSVLGPVRESFDACILLVVANVLFQLFFSCSVFRVWGIFINFLCKITISNLVSLESTWQDL